MFIATTPVAGVEETDLAAGASDRWEFFAFWGILPDTYRAAPPRPGFAGGSLFAITVVDLGIIEVSSSYTVSTLEFVGRGSPPAAASFLTFVGVLRAYDQFKVRTIAKFVHCNDLALQLEDRNTCAIKSNSRWLLLRLEAEEY